MPPLYIWEEELSGTKVEVLRKFADYELPPQAEELPAELVGKEHKWVRQIAKDIRVVKGPGWGPGKGYH